MGFGSLSIAFLGPDYRDFSALAMPVSCDAWGYARVGWTPRLSPVRHFTKLKETVRVHNQLFHQIQSLAGIAVGALKSV
jgi:hypothetical protein